MFAGPLDQNAFDSLIVFNWGPSGLSRLIAVTLIVIRWWLVFLLINHLLRFLGGAIIIAALLREYADRDHHPDQRRHQNLF